MVVFLTSSPTGPLDQSRVVDGLDSMNGFVDNLRRYWPYQARCLIISAFPEDADANDDMCRGMLSVMERGGFSVDKFDVWDDRTEDTSREVLHSYHVIFLGGGHVPTQNAFFHRIDLREKIQDFAGIIIGISAGTMNGANTVYAQPELAGEAVDSEYQRFLQGLGLTETNILPHYQMVKDFMLDGMRLFEDITYADSEGRTFLALTDGSYLLIEGGQEMIYGEAYVIKNRRCQKICDTDKTKLWLMR